MCASNDGAIPTNSQLASLDVSRVRCIEDRDDRWVIKGRCRSGAGLSARRGSGDDGEGSATVDELARAVELTENGVRAHLATLERDGMIRPRGVRRGEGAGKPATLYEIHPDAETALSRAYAPVLVALLDELADRIPEDQRDAIMSDVGRRLALAVQIPRPADLEGRVRAAAAVMDSLGGETQVARRGDALAIRGCGRLLSVATARRPEVCRPVQTLLTELIGAPVRERCDRGGARNAASRCSPPRSAKHGKRHGIPCWRAVASYLPRMRPIRALSSSLATGVRPC